jgi:dGTPase
MYRHYKVIRMTSKANRIIKGLFSLYMDDPLIMPVDGQKASISQIQHLTEKDRAIVIADFIAGMTDKFAIEEYRRLFEI